MSDERLVPTEDSQAQTDEGDRVDRVRRRMLKAVWAVPVVMAVMMPKDAFAQYGGGII